MPRGHGRVASNVQNNADRRNHTLLRRSLNPIDYKLSLKERLISALVLRSSEPRCITLTLVALELDAYWKIATFLPSIQGSDRIRSGSHSGLDGPDTTSPTAIIFHVDVQKEQSINLLENTCSPKFASACSSIGTHVMGQSRNRNKKTKSLKGSPTKSLPRCSVLNNSSGQLCDSFSAVSPDVLVNDIPKADKPAKRSSRKKGKKKGTQYKRSIHKKVPTDLVSQCEQSTCGASPVETSVNSAPACLGGCISENNLSEHATSLSLSVRDIVMVKDDNEINNDYIDSSTTMMSCISHSDEIDKYDPVPNVCEGFAFEDFNSIISTDQNSIAGSTQCPERILSTADVDLNNTYPKENNNCSDNSSNISLIQCDKDPVLDSFHDCWNSDVSENCNNDVERRSSAKDINGPSFSGGLISDSRKYDSSLHATSPSSFPEDNEISNDCYSSDCYKSDGIVHTHSRTERVQCSSQACSTNDFHPVISGKRGRTARKVTPRTIKDNNNHVWQKVQKKNTELCINEQKNLHVVSSQVDVPANESDTRVKPDTLVGQNQNQRRHDGRYHCSSDMVSQISKMYSFKGASSAADSSESNAKRDSSSSQKQANCYARKGSLNSNANSGRHSKIHVQQKEVSKILPQVKYNKHNRSGLNCPYHTGSQPLVVKPTEKTDFCHSEQQQKAREYRDKTISGNVGGTVCETVLSVAIHQIDSSLMSLDPLGQTYMHSNSHSAKHHKDMHEDIYLLDASDNRCMKLQADCSHAECSEPDNSSGPLLQKWVPVGRKDTTLCDASHVDNMTAPVIDESVPNKLDTESAETAANSKVKYFLPSNDVELQCLRPITVDADCLSCETDQLTGRLGSNCHTAGELAGVQVGSNCHASNELKDQAFSELETDLDKIIHAVNDAYKLQTAAECLHLVSDSPVTEFERFVRSATPVISQGYHSRSYITYSQEQSTNSSQCLHQRHNLSLRSLWQWYEEPGCYGLEVKAQGNHNSTRLHNSFVEFKAYFVPYLSAVQLFGRSGTGYDNCVSEMTLSYGADKLSKSSSYLGSLPILSMLLPQPRRGDACLLKSSSSAKGDFCNHSVRGAELYDEELIFEYFEHAQPPQRRPLFEKIKELVNGETSNSQMYGDPLKLECLKLCDLHPASWYSVAWYPIYRIPEGNFRAAFLTYHSLGHFVDQNTPSNLTDDFSGVVSPVVGLQSYNAKKECWFQLRGSIPEELQTGALNSDPSEILEERLRTLEHTASVMARATVRKGNLRSVNNHPDYNHFFSRW